MKSKVFAFCIVLSLTITTPAWSQSSIVRFEVLPGSTYTILPPTQIFPPLPLADVIYELEGLFSLEVNNDGTASFKNVDLFITPIRSIDPVGPQPLNSLESYQLEGVPSILIQSVYQDIRPGIIPSSRLTIIFDNPGTGGTLTGGFDNRPADGAGEYYQATLRQVAIPEPTGIGIIGIASVAVYLKRRRS